MALIRRHLSVAWYVLTVILPMLLRTGRRPVIFSRYAGMGDIIGTLPAALELAKRHPGAPLIYNCAASFACLPEMGGLTRRTSHLAHIGLVGYWYRGLLAGYYNFGSDDDEFVSDHKELFLRGYGRRHGVEVAGEHPRLHNRPAVLENVNRLRARFGIQGRPLVLLHPGPTWQVKQWPHESWAGLVTQLRQHGVASVVQLGTSVRGYANIGASDTRVIPGVVSLVDQLSLEESLALISQADLLVGVDSGLLHAAASFRVPTVGVWGATSPQFLFSQMEAQSFVVSRAACQGCHHRIPRLHSMSGCPHDIICMQQIPLDEVLQACLACLGPAKK